MGARPHLDYVPIEHLMLVRVQSGLEGVRADDQGRLVLSRKGSGREDAMNTFHFALNGAVSNHVFGKFDHAIAFVSPLQYTCAIDSQRPAGLDGADTYFHADANREMTLADATVIAPTGTQLPPGFAGRAVFYEPGAEVESMLANRNDAIAKEMDRRGAPLRTVAPVGWREGGPGATSDQDYHALGQALGCPGLRRNGHMNSPDWVIPANLGIFERVKSHFASGERLIKDGDGVHRDILGEYKWRLALVRQEFTALVAQTGCARAEAFYTSKIEKAEMTLGRLQKIREIEIRRAEIEEAKLAGSPKEWYLAIAGQPVGPMTIVEVRDYALDNPVDATTLAWRSGMGSWSAAGMVPELSEPVAAFRVSPSPALMAPPPPSSNAGSSLMDMGQAPAAAAFTATIRRPNPGVQEYAPPPSRDNTGLGL